eukprot:IDg10642t1
MQGADRAWKLGEISLHTEIWTAPPQIACCMWLYRAFPCIPRSPSAAQNRKSDSFKLDLVVRTNAFHYQFQVELLKFKSALQYDVRRLKQPLKMFTGVSYHRAAHDYGTAMVVCDV